MTTISGRYFTKPLFELLQTLQPTYFEVRSLFFKNLDGMLIYGHGRGLAKFADVSMMDCEISEGNANVVTIKRSDVADL